MRSIDVLVADDQPLVLAGVRAALATEPGIRLVGEARNGAQALDAVRRRRPDVCLMDIRMPQMDGLTASRWICGSAETRATRVVMLTAYDQDEYLFDALRAGVSGFVLKEAPTAQLVEAIRAAASGDALLSPTITKRLIHEFVRRPRVDMRASSELPGLTGRERDVFRLLVRGYNNNDIAEALVLGPSTVKSHVQHLLQKLGLRDRVQVVIWAYENGLVEDDGAGPPG